jgi:hypothetical protein
MTESEIKKEAQEELTKKPLQMIEDVIREANPNIPRDNLDIIKHVIKRFAVQQASLVNKAKWTNRWLIILSIVMVLAGVAQIVIPYIFPHP